MRGDRVDLDALEREARHEIERADRSGAVDDWVATPEEALALVLRIRELEDFIREATRHPPAGVLIDPELHSEIAAFLEKGAVLP